MNVELIYTMVLLANHHELAESKMVQKEVLRDVFTVHVRVHVLPRVSKITPSLASMLTLLISSLYQDCHLQATVMGTISQLQKVPKRSIYEESLGQTNRPRLY